MNFPRPRRGEDHPLAGFSNREAKAIRDRYRSGTASLRDLAKETGKHFTTIADIVHRKSYADDEPSP